MQILIAKDV